MTWRPADDALWNPPVRSSPPVPVRPATRWRDEALIAFVVTAFGVLAGGAVGAFWQAHATRIDLVAAVNDNEAAFKALLDDDMQFALIGIAGGVLLVLLAFAVLGGRARGPGTAIGLAIGGVLGALVAAHIGEQARQDMFTAALRHDFHGITAGSITALRGYFGFRLRTQELLLAWPVAAVVVHGLATALSAQRPREVAAAANPGHALP